MKFRTLIVSAGPVTRHVSVAWQKVALYNTGILRRCGAEVLEREVAMRIMVEFSTERPVVLPWNYLQLLQGLFYRAMRRGIPKLAEHLHDEGVCVAGKRYKLVTFSLLYPEHYEVHHKGLVCLLYTSDAADE